MGARAETLAERVAQGARDLVTAVGALTEAEWGVESAGEGRAVGMLVHHVGMAYLAERDIIAAIAAGQEALST